MQGADTQSYNIRSHVCVCVCVCVWVQRVNTDTNCWLRTQYEFLFSIASRHGSADVTCVGSKSASSRDSVMFYKTVLLQ